MTTWTEPSPPSACQSLDAEPASTVPPLAGQLAPAPNRGEGPRVEIADTSRAVEEADLVPLLDPDQIMGTRYRVRGLILAGQPGVETPQRHPFPVGNDEQAPAGEAHSCRFGIQRKLRDEPRAGIPAARAQHDRAAIMGHRDVAASADDSNRHGRGADGILGSRKRRNPKGLLQPAALIVEPEQAPPVIRRNGDEATPPSGGRSDVVTAAEDDFPRRTLRIAVDG